MVSIKGKINWKIFRRKTINQIEKMKETMTKELAKRKIGTLTDKKIVVTHLTALSLYLMFH
jgi:hypothetical protein